MITHDLAALWRTWANDYLTIDRFADDHGLTRDEAAALLAIGKKYQDVIAKEAK